MKKPNNKKTLKSPVKKASGILSISLGSMMLFGQTAYSLDIEKEVLRQGYISESATGENTLNAPSSEEKVNDSEENSKNIATLNESDGNEEETDS